MKKEQAREERAAREKAKGTYCTCNHGTTVCVCVCVTNEWMTTHLNDMISIISIYCATMIDGFIIFYGVNKWALLLLSEGGVVDGRKQIDPSECAMFRYLYIICLFLIDACFSLFRISVSVFFSS